MYTSGKLILSTHAGQSQCTAVCDTLSLPVIDTACTDLVAIYIVGQALQQTRRVQRTMRTVRMCWQVRAGKVCMQGGLQQPNKLT
jgi:hypothetical protein